MFVLCQRSPWGSSPGTLAGSPFLVQFVNVKATCVKLQTGGKGLSCRLWMDNGEAVACRAVMGTGLSARAVFSLLLPVSKWLITKR